MNQIENEELIGYLKRIKDRYPIAFDDYMMEWYITIINDVEQRKLFEFNNPEWIEAVTELVLKERKYK